MATKTKKTKRKKRTASAIGRQNRARGGAYERFVASKLAEIFPGARRGIGQARSGGDIPDVEGCGDFWVQCKSERGPNVFNALEQADHEISMRRLQIHSPCPYSLPLVVARRTARKGDVVALRLDHFVGVVGSLIDGANRNAAHAVELKDELEILRASWKAEEDAKIAAQEEARQLRVEVELLRSGSMPNTLEQREAAVDGTGR